MRLSLLLCHIVFPVLNRAASPVPGKLTDTGRHVGLPQSRTERWADMEPDDPNDWVTTRQPLLQFAPSPGAGLAREDPPRGAPMQIGASVTPHEGEGNRPSPARQAKRKRQRANTQAKKLLQRELAAAEAATSAHSAGSPCPSTTAACHTSFSAPDTPPTGEYSRRPSSSTGSVGTADGGDTTTTCTGGASSAADTPSGRGSFTLSRCASDPSIASSHASEVEKDEFDLDEAFLATAFAATSISA